MAEGCEGWSGTSVSAGKVPGSAPGWTRFTPCRLIRAQWTPSVNPVASLLLR